MRRPWKPARTAWLVVAAFACASGALAEPFGFGSPPTDAELARFVSPLPGLLRWTVAILPLLGLYAWSMQRSWRQQVRGDR